jgi:type IV fimbrial biogenesis protein FimT
MEHQGVSMEASGKLHSNYGRSSGVTLIELMIVVAVVAILSAIAAPGFASMRQAAARKTALDTFWHSIFLARSEAIKRNGVIALCRSVDGLTCGAASMDWSSGWIVFENRDHDEPATRDADEPILQVFKPESTIRITSNRTTFSFRPTTQGVVNGTIVFCDQSGRGEAIIISHTGRPRQSARDASNKPLQCTG